MSSICASALFQTDNSTLVCIHGQESTSCVYDTFKQANANALAFDLSGHGKHTEIDVDRFSFETYLDEIDTFLSAHKLEKVTLVAHSMGGRLAVVYASRNPERVQRLILLDTNLTPIPFKPGSDVTVKTLRSAPTSFTSLSELYSVYQKMGYPLRKLERWRDHGTIVQSAQNNCWHVTVSPYVGYLMRQHVLSSTLPQDTLGGVKCIVNLYLASQQSTVTTETLVLLQRLLPAATIQTIDDSTHQTIVDCFSHSQKMEEVSQTVL